MVSLSTCLTDNPRTREKVRVGSTTPLAYLWKCYTQLQDEHVEFMHLSVLKGKASSSWQARCQLAKDTPRYVTNASKTIRIARWHTSSNLEFHVGQILPWVLFHNSMAAREDTLLLAIVPHCFYDTSLFRIHGLIEILRKLGGWAQDW